VGPVLLVIAKEPIPGRVKTRLTPPLAPDQAAALARAALTDTLAAAVAARGATRRVIVLDGDPGPWLPPGFEVIPQRGDGLDERLAAAFEDVGEPAFLVGMDTPQVTPQLLEQGLRAVADGGTAFAMALDGGYWCIGLQPGDEPVFAGVPMSTERTGFVQLARMRERGLKPAILRPLLDVDTIDDARAVALEAPDSRFATTLAEFAAELAA
jgi:rSAM/selenodomain-associated transferase 1